MTTFIKKETESSMPDFYNQDMDMEDHAGPSSSSFQMDVVTNSLDEVAGVPVFTLLSVKDYLEENFVTAKTTPAPIVTSSKKIQGAAVEQSILDPTDSEAIVIGNSITTAYPRLLNEYIVAHQPTAGMPEYIFTESQLQKFSVVVKFRPGFQTIEPEYEKLNGVGDPVPRLFPSKKMAKEEGARLAYDYIQSIPLPENNVVQSVKPEQGEASYTGKLNSRSQFTSGILNLGRNKLVFSRFVDVSNQN